MTPFQQFTVWLSRASVAKRTSTGIGVAVVVALLGWLVTPPKHADSTNALLSQATGPAPAAAAATAPPVGTAAVGAAAPSGTVAVAGGPAAASAPSGAVITGGAGPAGAGSTATGQGGAVAGTNGAAGAPVKQCLPTVDTGTTDKTIRIAITLVDLNGLNDAVGLPSTQEQQQDWQWNLDAINAKGGAACRKLVGEFYNVNPIDTAGAQSICLKIAASKPFMVLEVGALTEVGAGDCIPEHKIPLLGQTLSRAQITKYYPYYLTATGLQDDLDHDAVRTWAEMGAFTAAKGFKKMGLVFHNCRPDLVVNMRNQLHAVGVTNITEYSLGCPPANQDTPADLQQAVLTMKNAGVTTVTTANYDGVAGFERTAAQQKYKPHYYLQTVTIPALSDPNGQAAPDPEYFDGAIDVIGGRYGEQTTPGFKPTALTAQCNKLFAAKGRPSVYKQKAGYGGVACAITRFAELAINAAPSLHKADLAVGLPSLGVQDFSYPYGVQDFSVVPQRSPWSRLYTRALQYYASDKAFHVITVYHKPFA